MSDTENRARAVWRSLCASSLVKDKKATPDNITNFTITLNTISPQTPAEKTHSSVVRQLSAKSEKEFHHYLKTTRREHWHLFGDARYISSALEIETLVDIKWDQSKNQFRVTAKGEPSGERRKPKQPESPLTEYIEPVVPKKNNKPVAKAQKNEVYSIIEVGAIQFSSFADNSGVNGPTDSPAIVLQHEDV